MLLCSASGISAICSIPTKNITMRLARTYHCTRTRRSHVASRLSVARWRSQFWAGCITNISERKFPTGTRDTEFAKRGFESVSIKRELPGGRIQVEANKLYPVHVEAGESIHACQVDRWRHAESGCGDRGRALHQDPA
jgi:hypothetical protein